MWDSFGFEFINYYFVPGLVLGCIYALGAIGITLTFGILRFANFAHGEIMMTGAFLTWTFLELSKLIFGFFNFWSHCARMWCYLVGKKMPLNYYLEN